MKKFDRMLREGFLSVKEENLMSMREYIDTMITELKDNKRKIDYYLDDMDLMPINHGLIMSEEFDDAMKNYLEEMENL